MLEKIITMLNEKFSSNKGYMESAIDEATNIYNAGWEAFEDGSVIQMSGNFVAVKSGNSIIKYEMKDFQVNSGKLIGDPIKTVTIIEIPESKRAGF